MTVTTNYLVTGNGITGSTANAVQALVSPDGNSTIGSVWLKPTGDTTGALDKAAFEAACTLAASIGAGVSLGAGAYYWAGTPAIAAPAYNTVTYGKLGILISGAGPGKTVINQLTGGITGLKMPVGTMMQTIRDLSLIGPETYDANSVGIYFGQTASTGSHNVISNCEIKGWTTGFRAWQCAFFTFDNCMIWKNTRGIELGNNVDGVHIRGGRFSNHVLANSITGAAIYWGWTDATHSPGVVTENNRIQIDGGVKFGENDVSFDFSDYWSGPIKINAYFENETKIAWLGDGVSTTSFTKLVEFDNCYFTVLSANVQIEARNPTTAVGSIAIRRCRTDSTDITGGFLKAGASISVDWQDNQLPSTLYQVQQLATQNLTDLGNNTHYRYNCDARAEADRTIATIATTATMTIATPAVITRADHKCVPGSVVKFSTTGALPTGIVSGTYYRVVKDSAYTSDAFHLEDISTGALINTSGSQSGVHTMTRARPMRSALSHSGTNQIIETWTRNGSDGKEVGQLAASIGDLDGKWVLYRGVIRIMDPITALPTASALYRGVTAYQTGAGGVADTIKTCMKNAADAYTWTTVATGT